jgi:hypothetical protein
MKPTELDAAPWIHELLNAMHNEWGTPTATILASRMVVLRPPCRCHNNSGAEKPLL